MNPSTILLTFLAVGLYAWTSLEAARNAMMGRRRGFPAANWGSWLAISILFAVLVLSRVLKIEDHITQYFRTLAREDGYYSRRREVQGPFTIAVMVLTFVAVYYFQRRMRRQNLPSPEKLRFVAIAGSLIMIVYVTLRALSLHQFDETIYKGGLIHVNQVIDAGLTVMVGYAAMAYRHVLRIYEEKARRNRNMRKT
jgi:phosphoglycerol transferase MdoB-like AlkP superfamily enzyme